MEKKWLAWMAKRSLNTSNRFGPALALRNPSKYPGRSPSIPNRQSVARRDLLISCVSGVDDDSQLQDEALSILRRSVCGGKARGARR